MGLIVLWERTKDENNIDVNLMVLRNNRATAVRVTRRADGGTVSVPSAQDGRAAGGAAGGRAAGGTPATRPAGRGARVRVIPGEPGSRHGLRPKVIMVLCTRGLFLVLVSLNNIHAKSSLLNLNTDRQKN